jgi:hypothetical protein
MHTAIYLGLYFFVRGTYLLRGLEKLYNKFMIVVLDLWRRMLYGRPAKLKRSIRVLARRYWIQLTVGLELNSGLRFYWWAKCVGMCVRDEVGTSNSLLRDAHLIVTCHIQTRLWRPSHSVSTIPCGLHETPLLTSVLDSLAFLLLIIDLIYCVLTDGSSR